MPQQQAQRKQFAQSRASGLNQDLAAVDVSGEEYTSGRNVVFREGFAQRVKGVADVLGDPIGSPVHLTPVVFGATAFWSYATDEGLNDAKIGVTDGTLHSDITLVGGITTDPSVNQPWTSDILNGIPVYNWGNQPPVFWDLVPGNPVTVLPGWETDATCGALRAFNNYLIAMDYTTGIGTDLPHLFRWSDSAPPGAIPSTWAAAIDNDAGELSASQTPGRIIDGLKLRNQFMIYKQGSTYTLDFIGGNFIFALRLLFTTTGILTRNCVAEFKGRHLIFTDGDVVLSDGHTVASVIDRRMRRHIFANIDPVTFDNSYVAILPSENEIWICYPTNGNTFPDEAVVWDYQNNRFGLRDMFATPHATSGILPILSGLPVSWDLDPNAWNTDISTWDESAFNPVEDSLVLADTVDGFLNVDDGITFNGTPISAILNRDALDLGDPERLKTVKAIWPRIHGNTGDIVNFRIGSQLRINDPILFSNTLPFAINEQDKIDVFSTGRFISVEISSDGGAGWELSGFDIEFVMRGAY